jgi:serine O-acetyltransferase
MFEFLKSVLFHSSSGCIYQYRFAKKIYSKFNKKVGVFLFSRLSAKYSIYIHPDADIGDGFNLPHPTGVVIGKGVVIGRNVTIYQGVTLGGARVGDYKSMSYPEIKDDVVIFSGAAIIGNVTIHNDAIIGANSLVNKSFEKSSVIAGVPAKLINKIS